MAEPKLPPLPEIDTKDSLPYSAIRYVPGYPEKFIHAYARAYGLSCYLAGLEAAAKVCDEIDAEYGEHPECAQTCAAAIRSLAAAPKEPTP